MSDTLKEKIIYIVKAISVILLFFASSYFKVFLAVILRIDLKHISDLNFLILTVLSDIFYVLFHLSKRFKKGA